MLTKACQRKGCTCSSGGLLDGSKTWNERPTHWLNQAVRIQGPSGKLSIASQDARHL